MPATKSPVTNTVLAVALFLAIIGGITWYVQYMPGRGTPVAPDTKRSSVTVQEVLRFVRPGNQRGPVHAVWDMDKDGNDAEYMKESEKGQHGEYCFLFQNLLDTPAEMEMDRADCDCTKADICILPTEEWTRIESAHRKKPWEKPAFTSEPDWTTCKKDLHKGIKIPAGAHGILRVRWDGRKEAGNLLKLKLLFWCQPEGDTGNRQITDLWVPVKVVQPLLFDPGQQSIGALGPGDAATATFYVWSATRTRDQLDVEFKSGEKDPLFTITAAPLTEKECADLQEQLRNRSENSKPGPIDTRVRAGYLVKATVHEQAGGQQMDQGPFQRMLPVMMDAAAVTFPTPQVTGHIRGPLTVGGEADQARVQFRLFRAAETKTVVVPVYGDPAFDLEVAEQDPPFLKIDLKQNKKESTAQRGRWDLRVTIPARTWSGPLPEQSRVVLRIKGERPRLVRIPVVGTATQ